jgi:hypothetical protein
MKKANMLSKLTGAHMAVLCEYNGETYIYKSDKRFSLILSQVRAGHRFRPDHFETVADRGQLVDSLPSPRPLPLSRLPRA